MPSAADSTQSPSLESLAREHFLDLSEAETRLVRNAPTGEIAFCGPSHDQNDATNDPRTADSWGPARHIRAELIRWICVDRQATEFVDPKGIQVFAAKIFGLLDLSSVSTTLPLRLGNCRLERKFVLPGARIGLLDLQGAWVHSVFADGAVLDGGVFLRNRFRSDGEVRFVNAKIGGPLDCSGGAFRNPRQPGLDETGRALTADGAVVKSGVFLRGFYSEGEVRLSGAEIGGNVECDGGSFQNEPNGEASWIRPALNLERVSVAHSVFLRNGFRAKTGVVLRRAQIGDDVDCRDGVFNSPAQPVSAGFTIALTADGIVVGGSVFFNGSLQADGEMRLLGATIQGDLVCDGATFVHKSSPGAQGSGATLNADGAVVEGCVFLRNGFRSEGEVRLVVARVGRNLECDGGVFKSIPLDGGASITSALDADQITVGGSVFLRRDFRAEGEVFFARAQVGGTFDCRGATIDNPYRSGVKGTGQALIADGLTIKGDMLLSDSFRVDGEVRLLGAQIGGDLTCIGGVFHNPSRAGVAGAGDALSADRAIVEGSVFFRKVQADGEVRIHGAQIKGDLEFDGANLKGTLLAQRAVITGLLSWCNLAEPTLAKLDLTNASANVLCDDSLSWPSAGNLELDGFVYSRISQGPRDPTSRLKWLALQKSFVPQPYRQFAKVLREEGDDAGARQVLYKMELERRTQKSRSARSKVWSFFLKWTVGYGYYPGFALVWLLVLVVSGFLLFYGGFYAGSVVPTDKDAYACVTSGYPLPSHYERFHASIYSLENSFPLVKLGQVDRWQPDPVSRRVPGAGAHYMTRLVRYVASPGFLRCFRWIQISLGWFFATMGLASITGIVRKD